MNYSTFKFALDLQVLQSQVSIPVTFGDTARKFYITLTDGGVPFELKEGFRAVLSGRKPDGNSLYNDCILDLKNSAIIYEFTEHTATAEGVTEFEVIIYAPGEKVMGSPRFIMLVDKRINGLDDVTSASERNAIDNIIYKTEAIYEAEKLRVTAETERVTAEEGRASAEEQRNFNESERTGAEDGRLANEIARVVAENLREEAEARREAVYESKLDKMPFTYNEAGYFVMVDDMGALKAVYIPTGGSY